jgi:hypothetical protein
MSVLLLRWRAPEPALLLRWRGGEGVLDAITRQPLAPLAGFVVPAGNGPAGADGDDGAPGAASTVPGPKGDPGERGSTGPAAPHIIPPDAAAGIFLSSATNGTAQITAQGAANRIEFTPFIPSRDITIDQLSIEVTTLIAASTARVGIYGSTGAGIPGELLTGQGSLLDCGTAGAKVSNISGGIVLSAGVTYWLALHFSSTQAVRALAVGSLLALSIPQTGTTQNVGRRGTATFASGLPATAPAAPLVSASMPRVALRLG